MAFAALTFTSCKKDSYYHTMSVQYPVGYKAIYADQIVDSVVFVTTDNFQVSSNVNWVSIKSSDASGEIRNVYRTVWEVAVPIYFAANTEGKLRTAEITIHTWGNDDWDNSARVAFTQFHWLDIYRPVPEYAWKNNMQSDAKFELTDSATQVSDTLKFYVHDIWTLTDGSSFAHPQTITGQAGENTVVLSLDANTTGEERKDSIVLSTLNGASTKIKIIQTK